MHRRMVRSTLAAVSFLSVAIFSTTASAGITQNLSLEEMLARSGMVVYGEVTGTDVRAGTEGKPGTTVSFEIYETLAGNPPSNQVEFQIPEGQWINTEKYFWIDIGPKFRAGTRYLLFYVNGNWMFSPITNFKEGVLYETNVNDTSYLTFFNGQCVRGVSEEEISRGPNIAPPASFAGPIIDGEQKYFEPSSSKGPDTSNLSSCLTRDQVLHKLRDVILALGEENMETDLTYTTGNHPVELEAANREEAATEPEPTSWCAGSGEEEICENEVPPVETP